MMSVFLHLFYLLAMDLVIYGVICHHHLYTHCSLTWKVGESGKNDMIGAE